MEIEAPVCPYCGRKSGLMDSKLIYRNRSYGMVWACIPCEAYVSAHKHNSQPLGTLADQETRIWRRKAHRSFDPLWKELIDKGFSKSKARARKYRWLRRQLNLPGHLCHIAMFDAAMCKRVIDICSNS